MRQIYCKKLSNSARSKKEFLLNYFKNNQPATYNVDDDSLQCGKGRQRSFNDLFNLVKTRFKSSTKPQIASMLIDLINEYNNDIDNDVIYIGCQWCGNIHEHVFHTNKRRWSYANIPNRNSKNTVGLSGISFIDLQNLANKYNEKKK